MIERRCLWSSLGFKIGFGFWLYASLLKKKESRNTAGLSLLRTFVFQRIEVVCCPEACHWETPSCRGCKNASVSISDNSQMLLPDPSLLEICQIRRLLL